LSHIYVYIKTGCPAADPPGGSPTFYTNVRVTIILITTVTVILR